MVVAGVVEEVREEVTVWAGEGVIEGGELVAIICSLFTSLVS